MLAMGLLLDRPESEKAGLEWDVDLGQSYEKMLDSMAWRHVTENLVRLREQFIQALVDGADGAASFREGIKLIDAVLRVPDKMITEGKSARAHLNFMQGGTDE